MKKKLLSLILVLLLVLSAIPALAFGQTETDAAAVEAGEAEAAEETFDTAYMPGNFFPGEITVYPVDPVCPETPEDPEPVVPADPEPVTPEEPETPEEPGCEIEPWCPTVPVNPWFPVVPECPEEPEDPEPVTPVDPEPVTPEEPETPEEPGCEIEPWCPVIPIKPWPPITPDCPEEPEEPEEPETPVEPEEPEEPEEPAVDYGCWYDHIDVEIDGQYTVIVDGVPCVLEGGLQADSIKVRIGDTVYDFGKYFVTSVEEPDKKEYRITVFGLNADAIDWVEGTYSMTNVYFSGRMLFAEVPDCLKDVLGTVTVGGKNYYYIDIEDVPYDGVQECTSGNGRRSDGNTGIPSGLDLYIKADGLEVFLAKGKMTIQKTVQDLSCKPISAFWNRAEFVYTITDAAGNPVLFKNGVVCADGCPEIYVKNGCSITLEGLPEGVYTITEAPKAGYSIFSINGQNAGNYCVDHVTVTKTDKEIPVVSFVNTHVTKGFAATLKKSVEGLPEGILYPAPVISIVDICGNTVWSGQCVPGDDLKYLTTYLPAGIYTVVETGAEVDNYICHPTLIVNGEEQKGMCFTVPLLRRNVALEVKNTYEENITEFNVFKFWEDEGFEDQRPESIKITLYADGAATDTLVEMESSEAAPWFWYGTVEGLPKYHEDGTMIVYTAIEEVPEGYVAEYEEYPEDEFTMITNTYVAPEEPAETDFNVWKIWNDKGYEDNRPESIKVTLCIDGVATDTLVEMTPVLEDSWMWFGVVEGLPKYHEDGTMIEYTCVEEVPEGYAAEYAYFPEAAFTMITNTYVPTTEVTVNKVWKDEGKNRPEKVTVQLYADGEACDTVELSEDNEWTYTWTGLDIDTEWTVDEVDVPAKYVKTVENEDGVWTITNSAVPETGDHSNAPLWMLLASLSALGMAAVLFGKKIFGR